jgi:hypothetical protein
MGLKAQVACCDITEMHVWTFPDGVYQERLILVQ